MSHKKYITNIDQIPELNRLEEHHRQKLKAVQKRYAFRSNGYYQSLIDWNDPKDPIRRIVIPSADELQPWGELDASGESLYSKAPGLEHKYPDTAVLLVSDVCGALCRFCFRKRLFMDDNQEVARDVSAGLAYIRKHTEINNVLVTGGDPLLLSTRKLTEIIEQLRAIEHVRIIRIGSKMPAFNPFRILDDPELLEMFKAHSQPNRRIYLMAQFNHPRELTSEARRALDLVLQSGVTVMHQTPMIRGVNDSAEVLTELFNELSYMGVAPYYVFQCRPTEGNAAYTVPIEEGYAIFAKAHQNCSGLARRCRYTLSHATGKIEVAGLTDDQVFFRYHRPADPQQNLGELLAFPRNPEAFWLDDYTDPQPLASNQKSAFC
ncbi:radical SAM domain iron-sulfur cluster-binding oxidoreductase [Syntrophotalea carbinolica DSM 2380]|uniref:Radical SAM domain iron-sulfur cluster-binding oxidoreductase n=1 Tax=Syntrophotalea carbinolica (strain DSM 2380 / NBRC 103641 / GraBd1) TaxID=338963 RepID=Q3A1Y1_SYNC1|nr:KamA family radical SAM protein [Syntrophotalea carbinolica]ABA89626.1 radical SAM domain iron-sulfur cluster-binding oxidoreductase [Syntrophotalea carbinolica DSM 2380]